MLYQAYQFQDDLCRAVALWPPEHSKAPRAQAVADQRQREAASGGWTGDDLALPAHPFAARLRHRVRPGRQPRRAGRRGDGARPAVRQASALRQGHRYAAAEGAGHRAAVGAFRDAAAPARCATLLRDHDVYITDWANARDVPLEAGRFGVDEYVDYIIRFLEAIGPGAHILAVCQPCVQALAAVAIMSEDKQSGDAALDDADGGADRYAREPDRRSTNSRSANRSPGSENSVIARVPGRYAGGGAGSIRASFSFQLHGDEHRPPPQGRTRNFYDHLAAGETAEAAEDQDFL